jgi:hypothetical protein
VPTYYLRDGKEGQFIGGIFVSSETKFSNPKLDHDDRTFVSTKFDVQTTET